MNDLWKSDNNIVPEKPANNGGKTSAEQVEGRALTKRNIISTAAVRTLIRDNTACISFMVCVGKLSYTNQRFQRYYSR